MNELPLVAILRGITLDEVVSVAEILGAIAAGADAVKLFPAEMLSPVAVRAIRAVIPAGFPLFAVGGIHAGNMPDYRQHGINGFGIGSALYRQGKSLADIRRDANSMVSAYQNSTRELPLP